MPTNIYGMRSQIYPTQAPTDTGGYLNEMLSNALSVYMGVKKWQSGQRESNAKTDLSNLAAQAQRSELEYNRKTQGIREKILEFEAKAKELDVQLNQEKFNEYTSAAGIKSRAEKIQLQEQLLNARQRALQLGQVLANEENKRIADYGRMQDLGLSLWKAYNMDAMPPDVQEEFLNNYPVFRDMIQGDGTKPNLDNLLPSGPRAEVSKAPEGILPSVDQIGGGEKTPSISDVWMQSKELAGVYTEITDKINKEMYGHPNAVLMKPNYADTITKKFTESNPLSGVSYGELLDMYAGKRSARKVFQKMTATPSTAGNAIKDYIKNTMEIAESFESVDPSIVATLSSAGSPPILQQRLKGITIQAAEMANQDGIAPGAPLTLGEAKEYLHAAKAQDDLQTLLFAPNNIAAFKEFMAVDKKDNGVTRRYDGERLQDSLEESGLMQGYTLFDPDYRYNLQEVLLRLNQALSFLNVQDFIDLSQEGLKKNIHPIVAFFNKYFKDQIAEAVRKRRLEVMERFGERLPPPRRFPR